MDQLIEARLNRIERSMRRWRGGCLAMAVAALAWVCHGAADVIPEVIRAHRLEIVNSDGKVCGEFEANNFGAILKLSNPEKPDTCFSRLDVARSHSSFEMNAQASNLPEDSKQGTHVQLFSGDQSDPHFTMSKTEADGSTQFNADIPADLHKN